MHIWSPEHVCHSITYFTTYWTYSSLFAVLEQGCTVGLIISPPWSLYGPWPRSGEFDPSWTPNNGGGNQGRLLHWSMDAACVLEKTRGGDENHAYFRENWDEEKLRGEERLNYLSTYLYCLLLIFSIIFSLAPLALDYINILTLQSGDAEHIQQGR